MKIFMLIAVLTATAPALAQDEYFTIGAINFFQSEGVNVDRIRAALPLREGDQFSRGSKERMVRRVRKAIRQATGREVSDVAPVCCDEGGRVIIYIGLGGKQTGKTLYNPSPTGSARLPADALRLHEDVEKAWLNAMEKGVSGEDDTQGYALSLDPLARAKQLALHAYVARHAPMVTRVLASARNVEHRQIAAELLGYADRSLEQISALIRASHDVDAGVRNNAIRALVVLARSSYEASANIPGECFVGLLNSGIWTDRNKSAELLSILTEQRNPRLLACLREQALTSLIEMARWSYAGHADSARLILGRIAGIDEKTLTAMVERREVEPIIKGATTLQKNADEAKLDCPPCAARQ